MKNLFVSIFALLLVALFTPVSAQTVEFGGLDKSPMDAAHYPRRSAFKNYLEESDADRTQLIKVLYSRPQKKDRDVFGGLEKWGQDWRLGANEATEVTFYQGVEIGHTLVPAGTYTIFAQLYPNQWIIKLSTERFIAGSENRDVSKDIVAVTVPTTTVGTARESFVIGFQKVDDNNVNMVFEWDKTRASLPINLNPPSLAGDDASPMDLVQFPNRSRMRNYVEAADMEANEPQVRVVYSRPQMKGRKVFGEMLEYGSMWRVGANETTLITFYETVMVGGKEIKPGTYGLFTMVNEDNWEFIIHKNVQSWGNNNHNEEDNLVKVVASTEKTPETLEALSMAFVDKGGNELELVVGWENTMARLPIKVIKSR